MIDLGHGAAIVVGIVGSRGFTDYTLVNRLVGRIKEINPKAMILTGDARGVDSMALLAAKAHGFHDTSHIDADPLSVDCDRGHVHVFEAEWRRPNGTRNGAAGHERNGRLVRHCTLLIALFADGPHTPGTTDAINQARQWSVPVLQYHEGKWHESS